MTLAGFILTINTSYPFILLPLLYLFWMLYDRQRKLKTLRIILDDKYLEWKRLNLNVDCQVDFEKNSFFSNKMCGLLFHEYSFYLNFDLGGQYMNQIQDNFFGEQVEENCEGIQILSPTNDNFNTSPEKEAMTLNKYTFKTHSIKTLSSGNSVLSSEKNKNFDFQSPYSSSLSSNPLVSNENYKYFEDDKNVFENSLECSPEKIGINKKIDVENGQKNQLW